MGRISIIYLLLHGHSATGEDKGRRKGDPLCTGEEEGGGGEHKRKFQVPENGRTRSRVESSQTRRNGKKPPIILCIWMYVREEELRGKRQQVSDNLLPRKIRSKSPAEKVFQNVVLFCLLGSICELLATTLIILRLFLLFHVEREEGNKEGKNSCGLFQGKERVCPIKNFMKHLYTSLGKYIRIGDSPSFLRRSQ